MAIDVSNTPDMYKITASGSFTFNTNCRVRNTPDMSDSGVATYTVGMSVSYDSKLKNGNHLWLSYIAASGTRRYIPYANTDTGVYFGTDSNSVNPIKAATSGSGSTGTGSTTGSLGSLTGQAGANVADQTPDGTLLVENGSFTFDETARGRDATNMTTANKVDSFAIGETVYYNGKIKADGHYWFRYIHTSGATYYVPYATIDPFRYYGTDSKPGDPVYSQGGSTGGNTGGTTGDAGGLTPGQTVIDFVKDLGAVSGTSEDNIAANNEAFQKLFTFAHSSAVTVNIPAGVFKIGRPNIGSNVDFVGADGATFLGTISQVQDIKTHKGSAFQYDGVSNTTWTNIIFRGINDNDHNDVYRLVHSILVSHYIKFTKCTFDQNEANGGHSLDLGGSDHIYVSDSTFIGVGKSTSSISEKDFYKEAIQTDYDYDGGYSARPNDYGSRPFTELPTRDVYIDGCRFLPLYTDSYATTLAKYGPQPVGTHLSRAVGAATTQVPNNIHLTNCLILDPKPANFGGYGFYAPIHFPSAENITITNNQIERRKTQVSPNVFMFYNYKKGTKQKNSGFYIRNNQIFNMNPQMVHVAEPDILNDVHGYNANAEKALKYAPSYALFMIGSTHTMDDIHVDGNQIYTLASDVKPANQDGKTITEKAKDIHSSSNMRVKGVGASTWTNANPERAPIANGLSGNESAHGQYSQSIYGVQPNGQKFLITTITAKKNLPYSYSLENYNGYSPAVSTITVGYDSADGNVYMPYL
ncbi:SH3 domain-containing protein [Levilactobacillus mulengensis]|uniref:SH3 domain-containing protein n=1 Tax=Levilactobacillus mulengensis TaxID=2486025 RepID=UPI000F796E04|nr:SH3 domain-containing protein [Levilactobacillus mulengensis]